MNHGAQKARHSGQSAESRVPRDPGGSGEPELRADFAGERTRGLHHARVNFHLLRFPVDLANQVIDLRDRGGNIPNDQGVGTDIGKNVAAGGQELFQRSHHRGRLGVAQDPRYRHRFDRVGLRLGQIPARIGFALQSILRCDPQNVAVDFLGEPIVAQHDVQALVPGNFVQDQSHRSANRRVQHNVEPADFMNQAEEILQIHVLEVHRNRVARIFLFRRGSGSRSLSVRHRRILRRGSRGFAGRPRETHVASRQPGGSGIFGTLTAVSLSWAGFLAG